MFHKRDPIPITVFVAIYSIIRSVIVMFQFPLLKDIDLEKIKFILHSIENPKYTKLVIGIH